MTVHESSLHKEGDYLLWLGSQGARVKHPSELQSTHWSWRSGPQCDWCRCLSKDDYVNLRKIMKTLGKCWDFHCCKASGKLAEYHTVHPLCDVSKIRQNQVVGEISKMRNESTLRRIVHFLHSTIYANFHMALLSWKMLRLPKYLKRTQQEEEALYAWSRTRNFFYSIQRMTEFLHWSFDVQHVKSITVYIEFYLNWEIYWNWIYLRKSL